MSSVIADIELVKLNVLDGLEFKIGSFLNKTFPIHFHHEWSLALIEKGNELLFIDGVEIQLNTGALVLIPPYTPHANRGNKNVFWKYKSIYINNDVIEKIVKQTFKQSTFINKISYFISYNHTIVSAFKKVFQNEININLIEKYLSVVITELFKISFKFYNIHSFCERENVRLNEVNEYLYSHFQSKITLEKLSKEFCQDKFSFLRWYVRRMGISPQEYLTALRIERAKKLMYHKQTLVDIALDCGFFDQSHFSNTFKKFVGLNPKKYRESCNILQD
jgi:AraC-like DNA-binding protein